jgi:predicted RNase H-like nuclease (RuvC/YqgF family)
MRSEKCCIVGVDIIRNGGEDLSSYLYAISIFKNSSLVKIDEGSLGHLIRLLWENRPAILAVDNIMELGGNRRNLMKILKLLPPDIEIVQVTLDNKSFQDLKKVAIDAGLQMGREKLEPKKAASTIAILASIGYGRKLNVFENKVKIEVYPGRSGSAGGSRSTKFKRNLRAAVARMVKKIREELDNSGKDYDVIIRKSKGGVEKALFIVYTTREELIGVIKKAKGKDVVVKIKPVINKKFLSFSEDERPKRYLIIGYDPGMKVGLAVIDLDGKPVLITSGRTLDRGEIANLILKEGIPAIVATDKNPVPEMVRKLAAMLGAQLYVPSKSLSSSEKELLVRSFCNKHGIAVKNTHERDALSSAIKAFRVYEEKARKLAARVKSMGLPVNELQKYKARLISDEPLSTIIEDIIDDVVKSSQKRKPVGKVVASNSGSSSEEALKELNRRLDEVIKERELYKEKVKELEMQVLRLSNLVNELEAGVNIEILKDRKVKELMQRVSSLERHLARLRYEKEQVEQHLNSITKAIDKILTGNYRLVPNLGGKCFIDVSGDEKIRFVDDLSLLTDVNLRKLKNLGIALILPPGNEELASYLVNSFSIPSTIAKEVWSLSRCVKAVDSGSVLRLKDIILELERSKAEAEALTPASLEALLSEYRESRSHVVRRYSHNEENSI